MTVDWKKVAMIMLVGLLTVAGPTFAPGHVSAQNAPGVDKYLTQAQTDHDKAMQMYNSLTNKMTSTSGGTMTSNEKAMMSMMHDMAQTLKMLLDSNQQLLDALKQLRNMPK
jgi:exopolyphosphatase/pppGpp-phosphohydrolase